MTTYTTSPEAIREYMTAKERTEWWIHHHPPAGQYSPSAPPSDRDDLEEDGQSYTAYDSDEESTHSVPPKMMLKFGDGRPDVQISHWHHDGDSRHTSKREADGSQSRPSFHRRGRSEQAMIGPAAYHIDAASAPYPEKIRVLPSQSNTTQKSLTSQDRRRAKSQPRHGYSPPDEPAPPLPRYPHAQHTPTPQSIHTPAPRPIHATSFLPHAPPVAYSQSHPMYHGRSTYASRHLENSPHRNVSPPSIVYAPRPYSKNNYAPPTMIHHSHGAPGLTYSQSAPLPRQPHAGATPFPTTKAGLTSVDEEMLATKSRNGSRGPARMAQPGAHFRKSHSPSQSSEDSGSTYYIIPTPGQKVQVITPDKSLNTATSTTQSPSPPHSGTSKKPFFFSRFFNIAEKLASVDHSRSSSNGKRLQRRHSTDASGRRRRN